MLDEIEIQCPHCGERFTAFADPSAGDADYIEDCPVCCRPIQLRLQTDGDGAVLGLDADRD